MNVQQFLVYCGLLCLAGAGYETGGATMATDILTDGLCSQKTVYLDKDGGFASSLVTTGRSAISRMIHNGRLETKATGTSLFVSERALRSGTGRERDCIFKEDTTHPDKIRYRYRADGMVSGTLASSLDKSRQEWLLNGTGMVQAESREEEKEFLSKERLSLIGTMNGWYRFMMRPDP
ncbi:MAG: hypothetical protein JXA44_07910 [Methanospirillaceae archaeon]|nr:hypothetical protein [Methanospirillaceae archaeon]